MNLFDRLKPRWRRSDPDERAAAARDMGAHDQGRLATLAANDPEPRVRRVAIKKLEDLAALDLVAARDADPALRAAAVDRATEIRLRVAVGEGPLAGSEAALAAIADERSLITIALTAVHAQIRGGALARLSGDRALREIIKQATDREQATAALARITDASSLRAVALGEGPPELGLAALERISDVDVLAAIANQRNASKAIRRRARELLPAGMDDQLGLDAKAARSRQIELGSAILAVRALSDVVQAAERARAAEQEWLALARVIEPKAEVAARFVPVCRAIIEDGERLVRLRAEADAARDRANVALTARQALCARVERLEGADVPEQLAKATAEWQHLPPWPGEAGAELERRFRVACAAQRETQERARNQAAQHAELIALVDEAEELVERGAGRNAERWRRLEARFAGIASPSAAQPEIDALRRRFTGAAERYRRQQEEALARRAADEQENLARLEALHTRLQTLAAAEELKLGSARAELKAVDAALADFGPLPPAERRNVWKERLTEVRAQLRRRVADLEEAEGWRRWANADAQEAIITRAEALRASDDLPDITVQLKQIQDDWAQYATTSPDKAQALWERFRAVRDELRARVDTYLADNLQQKRGLCDRVATLGESTAWKEAAEIIKQAQAEWKEIGPVPVRQSQEIWRRFREPCDRFFERRQAHFSRVDEERRGNADRQTQLCERAEALQASTDWDTTATALKALQADWKRSGPAPREQADALWTRFRAACDGFFDRFHRRDALEQESALAQATGFCEQLEALVGAAGSASAPTADGIRTQLDEIWGAWLRLDLGLVEAAAPLGARLAAAGVQLAAAAPEALPGSRLDPAATRKRRERLCERLEALATSATTIPRELSLQEQVLALRERIATNTIAKDDGGSDGGVAARGETDRIRLSWAALGPPLDDTARQLDVRFVAALDRLVATPGALSAD